MNIRLLEELSGGSLIQVEFCHPDSKSFATKWARSKTSPTRFTGTDIIRAVADGHAVLCKSDDRPPIIEMTDAGRRAVAGLANAWEAA